MAIFNSYVSHYQRVIYPHLKILLTSGPSHAQPNQLLGLRPVITAKSKLQSSPLSKPGKPGKGVMTSLQLPALKEAR